MVLHAKKNPFTHQCWNNQCILNVNISDLICKRKPSAKLKVKEKKTEQIRFFTKQAVTQSKHHLRSDVTI